MKTLVTAMGLALSMFIGTSALAAKPAFSVDCQKLYYLDPTSYLNAQGAIVEVDDYLQTRLALSYRSLGDLLSAAILSNATGGLLVGLLNDAYNGTAFPTPEELIAGTAPFDSTPFTSARQVISTVAGCGLTPNLIAEIND